MNQDCLKRIGDELLELARRIGRKLKELHGQAEGHADLRRLGLCCILLLTVVFSFSPLLGLACFLGAGLYLSM